MDTGYFKSSDKTSSVNKYLLSVPNKAESNRRSESDYRKGSLDYQSDCST